MRRISTSGIIKGIAVTVDVAVPLAATFTQFPVWIERSSEATVSGLFLVFAFLSCLPFLKRIKEYFRSPSSLAVWLVLFLVLVCLNNIIKEMLTVALFGLLSSCIGTVLWKIGDIADADNKDGSGENGKNGKNK